MNIKNIDQLIITKALFPYLKSLKHKERLYITLKNSNKAWELPKYICTLCILIMYDWSVSSNHISYLLHTQSYAQ